MDSFAAFAMGRTATAMNSPHRVFDWHKAAELIRKRKPLIASAGLRDDWEYTGGEIYRDGKPVPKGESYTYLASNWAIPELDMDGEIVECFVMLDDSPGWGSHTYWPKTALAILDAEEKA